MIDNNILLGGAVYAGVVLVAFWVAMIIWVYRDMGARSRDGLAKIFAAAVVAVLTIPGLFIYILMRPRETLSEAYERSLEEEALLQEIEEKPTCPGCGQRVHDDWQACAYCHTRLKKPCRSCKSLLELSWNLCPYCAADQSRYDPNSRAIKQNNHVRLNLDDYQTPYESEPPQIPDKWLAARGQQPPQQQNNYPEYVDDDYYAD
ncbi:MAG: zinc ribbon domain-containing protein [Chloroflexota bacterium]